MIYVVETEAELNTRDFLGVNITRGAVIELCPDDFRRPFIQEAIQKKWIRPVKSPNRLTKVEHSRVVGRAGIFVPTQSPTVPRVDMSYILKRVDEIQVAIDALRKEKNTGKTEELIEGQNKILQELTSALSKGVVAVQTTQAGVNGSGVVEEPTVFVPTMGNIEGAKSDLIIQEKKGDTVKNTTERLRALRKSNG